MFYPRGLIVKRVGEALWFAWGQACAHLSRAPAPKRGICPLRNLLAHFMSKAQGDIGLLLPGLTREPPSAGRCAKQGSA